jgi:hypothetical protein
VRRARGEEHEARGCLRRADRQQAEFVTTVHIGEEFLAVLEVVQADDLPAGDQVAEEGFGAVISGDAGRHDDPRPPVRREQGAAQFGEERVGV